MTEVTEQPQSDPPEITWGLLEVLFGLMLAIVLGAIFINIYYALAHTKTGDALTLSAVYSAFVGGWIAFGGTSLYVSGFKLAGLREKLGFRFKLPVDIWKGVSVGLLAQLMVIIIYLPLTLTNSDIGDTISDPANRLTSVAHGWRWIPFAFAVAIVSPVCEELFFRGVALRAFVKKWGTTAGIVASGLLFGIAHFEGIQTPALVIFGWILAWRATKTGRIGETIVAHSTFNSLTLLQIALS